MGPLYSGWQETLAVGGGHGSERQDTVGSVWSRGPCSVWLRGRPRVHLGISAPSLALGAFDLIDSGEVTQSAARERQRGSVSLPRVPATELTAAPAGPGLGACSPGWARSPSLFLPDTLLIIQCSLPLTPYLPVSVLPQCMESCKRLQILCESGRVINS